MPIEVSALVDDLVPERTILLFGAGSSIPSGGPSGGRIIEHIATKLRLKGDGFTLREISSLGEHAQSRHAVISALRELFTNLKPTRGLLTLPLHSWKGIYTTNYDELIEDSYKQRGRLLTVFSSNFDFKAQCGPETTKLFKLHGTISKDVVDGYQYRLVLTDKDYDQAEEYREYLFNRLKNDLSDSTLLIIGQSLEDPDIRNVIQDAVALNQRTDIKGRIILFIYTPDQNRAALFEMRGLRVCFGSIDDFLFQLNRKAPSAVETPLLSTDALDSAPLLRPITIDAAHASSAFHPSISSMFSGWPASYADIKAGSTFARAVGEKLVAKLREDDSLCTVLLGASGVGKTTAARQALSSLLKNGWSCWEHIDEHPVLASAWLRVAKALRDEGKFGVLLVDDCHSHLHDVSDLVDLLSAEEIFNLKLLLVSSRGHWNPRIKTPNIYRYGAEFQIRQLISQEIDELLALVERNKEIASLADQSFSGFSRQERRRRLVDRCEADMFVCLKNIFASEKFDDIILREYASLDRPLQDVYRLVAALEHAGVRVHRQLVIRILGIAAASVEGILNGLADIIHEYAVNTKEGIYGWKGRHPVIVGIIAKVKFSEIDKLVDLLLKVIDSINPTYDIEIRTIRELCNVDSGIAAIPDKRTQNQLLQRMASVAPGERIPRHRLIRNLIELGEFEKAETEMRIFEKDFRTDGPVHRYRVSLLLARATRTPGLMDEDRVHLLNEARNLAVAGIEKFPFNKTMLTVYGDVGIEIYRKTGKLECFDDAMAQFKAAETRIADPEITVLLAQYERRISGQIVRATQDR